MSSIKKKTIRSASREIIYRVFTTSLAEYEARKPLVELEDVFKRTAFLTGKSESSIRRIAQEGEKNGGVFMTPGKNKSGRPKKQLDDFDLSALRQKIMFFYTVKKEVPTLKKLQNIVKQDFGHNCCLETIRKQIMSIGFKFKKCQSNRKILIERPHIASKREYYLKKNIENRMLPEGLKKYVVYLDESYIHESYKVKKCWQSVQVEGVSEAQSKGKRWIIIHAGGENGFVPNALTIFTGKNKQQDYHSEMNASLFKKWVTEKLLPNIPDACIIVMDNAPYHSVVKNKAPTSVSKIADIKLWLTQNNISFDPDLRKPNLLMLVKQNKPDPVYEIDEILAENGHEVIRLPPYHCDLNPIELIWASAKKKVAAKNIGGQDVKQLTVEAFHNISVTEWKNCCQHVIKIENDYFKSGATIYEDIEQLVIPLGDDSSSSDDFNESSGSESPQPHCSTHMEFSGVDYLDFDSTSE